MNNKHNYTATDFERYYSGAMSHAEMHALEKAALEDDFLAAALEGYAHAATPVADSRALRQRLAAVQRKKRPAVVPLFFKYAAVLVVLAGLAVLFYQLNNNAKPEQDLAKVEEKTPPEFKEALPATADTVSSATGIPPSPTTPGSGNITYKGSSPASERSTAVNDQTLSPVTEQVQAETVTSMDSKLKDMAAEKTTAPNQVSGKIIDAAGNPVPNATVFLEGKTAGVQTDDSGKFKLALKDTSARTTVAAVGFNTTTVDLKKNEEATIRLDPQNEAMAEVVVTSTNKKSAQKVTSATTRIDQSVVTRDKESSTATPVGGWDSLRAYISTQARPQYAADGSRLHGNVLLTFRLSSKGEPRKISVKRSLSATADQEAIRLLKNGPRWSEQKQGRHEINIGL